MTHGGPDFDFGPDPHCDAGLLRAVVLESGDLVLWCDEDEAVYRHPEEIGSVPAVFPRQDPQHRIGDGHHLRPGSWRLATRAEVEVAGWQPYLRVELLVLVTGPPEILADGRPVAIGASATQGSLATRLIPAYLALKRELGGRTIRQLLLIPADADAGFDGLRRETPVVGAARPVDGGEELEFTGTARRWEPVDTGAGSVR